MSSLSKLRIAVLVADGVEQIEMTEPVRAWQSDGATVHLLAPRPGKIQSFRGLTPGILVDIDEVLSPSQPLIYDAIHIPGGALHIDRLRGYSNVRLFLWAHNQMGKPCGAVGHGPLLLTLGGLAQGRTLTSCPTGEDAIRNAGAHWIDQPVVSDRNWITARANDELGVYLQSFRVLMLRFAQDKSRAA